tara:strand:+ start:125 stop:319 length:195 start_codon:yes stop_codon:yes gene_type:complete
MNINSYTYEAVGIAEGFIECEDEEKVIEAWQHLINTGLAYELQGRFGRIANHLIEEGICKRRDK